MHLPRFSRTLTLPIAPPYTCNAPSLAVGPHIAVPSHRSAWPEFGGTKPLWDRAEGERLDCPDLGVAIAMEFTDRNGHTTTFNGTLSDDQATLVWANRLCGPPNALGWARACGRPWWAASPRSAPTYTSLGGDCVGGNLIPGVMADRETCEQLCNAHPRCTGFSHDGVSCIIKDESVHSTGEYGDEPCIVDWLSDGQIWDYWQQDWESRRVRDYRERCALDTPEGGWCAVPQDRRDAPGCDLAGSQGSILHCLRQLRAMWYEESVVAALPRASVTLSSVCCYMNGACRTPGPVTCDGASLCIDGQDGQGAAPTQRTRLRSRLTSARRMRSSTCATCRLRTRPLWLSPRPVPLGFSPARRAARRPVARAAGVAAAVDQVEVRSAAREQLAARASCASHPLTPGA